MTNIDETTSLDGCPPGRKTSYDYEELLQCARGKLFGLGSHQLSADRVLFVGNKKEVLIA